MRRQLAPDVVEQASLAAVLGELMWDGQVTNDTFAPVRSVGTRTGGRTRGVPRRRISSRRSRLRLAEIDAAARAGVPSRLPARGGEDAALSGRWSLLIPSRETDTVRGIAIVESILDRYGVLSRDIVTLSGVPGGMAALFPVLRSMEDVGDVVRGVFVEGFGPAQFAARETVDLLRTYAGDTSGKSDGEAGGGELSEVAGEDFEGRAAHADRPVSADMVVLAADDPACLFGAGIPWPPIPNGQGAEDPAASGAAQGIRPARRSGSLVVVADGTPVLHATAGLRSILAFVTDGEVLAAAVQALVAQVARSAKGAGGEDSRRKILVETFNGLPVLSTPFADILHASGLVRLPDGMRLYVLPF